MKWIRRIVATCCIIMLLAAALQVSAAGVTISAENATAAVGADSVCVTLSITGNTGLSGLLLSLSYDSALTLTKIERGTALASLEFTPGGDLGENPVRLLWDGVTDDTSDGTFATLYFALPENAAGTYSVEISCDPENVSDSKGNSVSVVLDSGSVAIGKRGDYNGDSKVNLKDVMQLWNDFVNNTIHPDRAQYGDYNKDGKVNLKDVMQLWNDFVNNTIAD